MNKETALANAMKIATMVATESIDEIRMIDQRPQYIYQRMVKVLRGDKLLRPGEEEELAERLVRAIRIAEELKNKCEAIDQEKSIYSLAEAADRILSAYKVVHYITTSQI